MIVFWNIHFDGLAFAALPGAATTINLNELRALLHCLDNALVAAYPTDALNVKYFINSCGVGRQSVEAIATPPTNTAGRELDLASFEQLVLVEKIFSIFSTYIRCEIFDLYSFKRDRPMAPFPTIFRFCFSVADLLSFQPVYIETTTAGRQVEAPFEPYLPSTISHSAPVPAPTVLPALPVDPPSSSPVGLTPAADTVDSTANRKRKYNYPTVSELLECESQSSRVVRNRDRTMRPLLHLRQVELLDSLSDEVRKSVSVYKLLPEINEARATRQKPPLKSVYDNVD